MYNNKVIVRLLLISLAAFSILGYIEGLKCFQCAETTNKGYCYTDIEGLLNASKGLPTWHNYANDCPSPKWDRCMIETLEKDGDVRLFHRGCHGSTFLEVFNSTRFHNKTNDNQTTCSYIKELAGVVCYTFCQSDFCNGPQPPPKKMCNVTYFGEDSEIIVEEPCDGSPTLPVYLAYVCSILTTLYFLKIDMI